jgi:hypothetical protein
VEFNYSLDPIRDNTISDSSGYVFEQPAHLNGCVDITNPSGSQVKGDPNLNCVLYEIADAVLVAQRLIYGYEVWSDDDLYPASPTCNGVDTHYPGNDALQEAGADLNSNGHADVGDLVWFIGIINDILLPPAKLDPSTGNGSVTLENGACMLNTNIDVGAVVVKIAHTGEMTPVASNGLDMQYSDKNGVLAVVIYSLRGQHITSGSLFTISGSGTVTDVQMADSWGRLMDASAPILPTAFAVSQNYPNPFNAKTEIRFALPTASDVTINIYSITGQVVGTISGHYEAGNQSVVWDGSNVASGIYFYKLNAGSFSQTMKMTLLK